ncbi:MAG: hypothetical protein ACC628_06605, partial [Pirellulaceae bacterium]
MRPRKCLMCLVLLLLASSIATANEPNQLDLRRAVPDDVYLVVHGKHNPERDFQREYCEAVWETIQETQILEKTLKMITAKTSADDIEKAKAVIDEIRQAAAPIDIEAILNSKEVLYAQMMQIPTAQHLVALRLTPEAAASTEQAVKNLFGLIEKYSEGDIGVETSTEGDATITTLGIPAEVPFKPAVARIDDIIFFTSAKGLLDRSLKMMVSGEGKSKFDDPRLKDALKQLPEPEDVLVFYDGKTQFQQMRELGTFIRQASGANPDAERIAGILDLVFEEMAILDFEVTVGYTEGHLNRTASYGKLLPNIEDKVLTKALVSGTPFVDWHTWVPANAQSFSLSTGVDLHPLYEGIIWLIENRIPEAQPGLAQFNAIQEQWDFDLDRDILQAFSGESVSVVIPSIIPSLLGGQDSVTALRCQKPDRIRELLHRLVEQLQQQQALKGQQLKLVESETLEGFEEVSALGLTAFGIRPVIGFRDGWMIIGSNTRVIQKLLDTRAGQGDTILDSDTFKQFNLDVEGPVASIKYSNLAASTRQAAAMLSQAGMFAPMIIGAMNADADSEELKPIQDLLTLLPSVGKIVGKFDFLQAQVSVIQTGDQPGSYRKRSVTVVQPPQQP